MQTPAWARDAGLIGLALATVALAGYVAVRDPATDELTGMTPTFALSPSAFSSPSPSPPAAPRVPALLLRAQGVPVGHVVQAAPGIGWQLAGAMAPPVPAAQLAGKQVIVVVAGEGSAAEDERLSAAEAAARTLREVRALAPQARIVLVAPLGVHSRPLDEVRDLLRAAALQVSADFIDPVGSRWLQERPQLVRNSALTSEAAPVLSELVVRALQRAQGVRASSAPAASGRTPPAP